MSEAEPEAEPEVEARPERRVGWRPSRARLVEMTVVVFGVLIALGLENAVEELRLRGDARKLEEHQRDHSLYVAFAPVDEPRVALAVIVENAGFGAAHAAPIARRVFDYLLLDQYPNPQDMLAVQRGQAAAPIGTPLKASDMPWPPADATQAAMPTEPAAD